MKSNSRENSQNPSPSRRGKSKSQQQSKSQIKHLPTGKCFGVADDFPKEVDEIRKELYAVLKTGKEG